MKNFYQYIKELKVILLDGFDGFLFLFFLFLLLSIIELLGISIIVPYVSLISDPDFLPQTKIFYFLGNLGFEVQEGEILVTFSLILLAVFFFKFIFLTLANYLIYRFCFNKALRLKSYLMNGYQKMPFLKYSERNSSEYIYNITSLVDGFSIGTLQILLRTTSEIIIALSIFILLALNNFVELLVLVFIFISVFVLFDSIFKKRLIVYGRLSNEYSTKSIQGVNEGVEGMKEIRILGKEKYFHNKVYNSFKGYANINILSNIIINLPRGLIELVMIFLIVMLALSVSAVAQDVDKVMTTLVLFGVASVRLIPSASVIISGINSLRNRRDSNTILYNDIKFIKDKINTVEKNVCIDNSDFKVLSLDAIGFKYPKASKNTINNISINIKSGDSIGIIGKSGCGKTTLINLILGLIEPQYGKILYNGKALANNIGNWQSHIAYLPQQVFLIDDTLRNNIALGCSNVDENKLKISIHKARLGDFVDNLPNGVDSLIGERGVLLSGGQRQRIALARAFYYDKDVLIMDESTSSLDGDTEREIIDEIKRLKSKKTIIVIAHRITTLKFCDVIYEVDNGKIANYGDYNFFK
jgi:ATP-binding cassette, subfamily B, bacterial PglK